MPYFISPTSNQNQTAADNRLLEAMPLLLKSLFFILLIFSCAYLVNAGSARSAPNPSSDKVRTRMKMRKLIGMMDYELPGANPGHDPRRGGSGSGGGRGSNSNTP